MAKYRWKWLPKRRYSDLTLLMLRLASGGLMLTHGLPKMERLLEGNLAFADPIGIGEEFSIFLTVFAEVVCAGLIVLGMLTRLAVLPLIITMLVAIFIVHIHDPLHQKELAIFYLLLYCILLAKGPGKLSLDQLFFGKKATR
ncbi:MAG: DoxX family protein [Luteibaculum sp.]